jgi:toxin YoeB
MHKNWYDEAWNDYISFQKSDRKTLEKINKLIQSVEREGESQGIGHPEPLSGDLAGWWSRHIDEKNRLVYCISQNLLNIRSCKTHYGDK